MNDQDLPLLELFTRLRDAGLLLGIDDYQALLQALQAGFGTSDRDALARLCRALWVKSDEDKLLFDYHFEQVMISDALLFRDSEAPESTANVQENTQKTQVHQRFNIPWRISYAALGGFILLASSYGIWFFGLQKQCPYFTSTPVTQAKLDKEYRYNIATCKPKQGSVSISAVKLPPWLKLKDNRDGTATLTGTPTSSDNRVIYLWNLKGNRLATLQNQGNLSNLKFNSDGQYFAAISHNKEQRTALVWDKKGNTVVKLEPQQRVEDIHLSSNAQRFATKLENGSTYIWNIKGDKLNEIKSYNIKFSIDGNYFAFTKDNKTIIVSDFEGKRIRQLKIKSEVQDNKFIFSPKSQLIAAYSTGKIIYLWDINGNKLAEWKEKISIDKLKFSDDEQYIITESDNPYNISLRDLKGKQIARRKNQANSAQINLSPDAQHFTTISSKNTINLWSLEGKRLAQLQNQSNLNKNKIRFSPYGQYFATVLENGDESSTRRDNINLWDFKGNLLKEFQLQNKVIDIAFSPNGNKLAAILDNSIYLWDFKGNILAKSQLNDKDDVNRDLSNHFDYYDYYYYNIFNQFSFYTDNFYDRENINQIYFNSNGQRVTTIADTYYRYSEKPKIKLWDLKGDWLSLLDTYTYSHFTSVTHSPDKQRFTTSNNEIIQLRDFTGKQLKAMRNQGLVLNVKFASDSQRLNNTSVSSITRIWDFKGNQLAEFNQQNDLRGNLISFSQDGKFLADISINGNARLWNYNSNLLAELKSEIPAYRVVFNYNNQILATYLEDGSVRLWNTKGNQIAQIKPSKTIYTIDFSPDAQTLATRLEDGSVRLWDMKGNQIAQIKPSKRIYTINFSPDGQTLATYLEDGSVRLWDRKGSQLTKSKISRLDKVFWSSNSVTLSNDKQLFATVSNQNTVYLRNLTGKQIAVLKHQAKVTKIEFNDHSKYIATVLENNVVHLWNLQGKQLGILKPKGKLHKIYFSFNGQYIITNSGDNTIINVWNFAGNKLAEFTPQGGVYDLYFSPDGKRFATVSYDQNLRLWNLQGNQIAKIKIPTGSDVNFGSKSKFFIISNYKTIYLWDFDGNKIRELPNQNFYNRVTISPDGEYFTTTAINLTAHLWDIQGNQLAALPLQDRISIPRFSPDGEHFFTFSDESTSLDEFATSDENLKTLKLWDIRQNQAPVKLQYQGKINDTSFSPNGQQLATASGDGAVHLWDMKGKLLNTLWHQRPVDKVSFGANGQYIATIARDGSARLWNLRGNQQRELKQQGMVNRVDFTPDQRHLYTLTEDDTVNLWNFQTEKPIELKHRGSAIVEFNPNGKQFVTASKNDNIVRLWDLKGVQLAEFKHPDWVSSINFSKDGQYLVTTSKDSIARIWNLKRKLLSELQHPSQVSDEIIFSPDGQHFLTSSADTNQKVTLKITAANGRKDIQSFAINTSEDLGGRANAVNIYSWIVASLIAAFLAVVGLLGGYVFARWLIQYNQQREKQSSSEQPKDASASYFASDTDSIEDEMQVAQAVRHSNRAITEFTRNLFSEGNEYFPVTRRQMKQSWRYLRQFVREALPTELDVEATIKEVSRQGFLVKPVLAPRRVNRTELLLLIDQDGSMVPFHSLSRRLAETALYGGRLAKAGIYYFHNCPVEYLYKDSNHQEAETVNNIITSIRSDYTGVMIFSDAGAARGGINPERIELTAEFLAQLQQKVRFIVWLNPVPQDRWKNTTAYEIAKLVPMFQFNRLSLHEAINVLRGKPVHHKTLV